MCPRGQVLGLEAPRVSYTIFWPWPRILGLVKLKAKTSGGQAINRLGGIPARQSLQEAVPTDAEDSLHSSNLSSCGASVQPWRAVHAPSPSQIGAYSVGQFGSGLTAD